MTIQSPSLNVLITGASRGLGQTLARFLAGEGANLILTARGNADLQETAQDLRSLGVQVIALPGDIRSADHRARLAQAAQTWGGLDLLINNASALGPSPQPALADYPLDALAEVLAVNVVAQVGMVQAVLPLLRVRQGLIINISSDAALGAYAGWGGYGASKAALDLISRTLTEELAEDQICVVSVDPGDMRTHMHQEAFPGENIDDRPLPDVTIPFWGWLLGQERGAINGHRFQAQAEEWVIA